MGDMIWYETYHEDEDTKRKAKKRKARNRAMLDEESPVNRYHKRGKTRVFRKSS